jgi:hypothetical protein
MKEHVGILLLWGLRPVALGIGIRRDVERILANDPGYVIPDVLGKLRIDLVKYVLAIEKGPHFTNGFVADTVTTPPTSSRSASVALRFAHQSPRV